MSVRNSAQMFALYLKETFYNEEKKVSVPKTIVSQQKNTSGKYGKS